MVLNTQAKNPESPDGAFLSLAKYHSCICSVRLKSCTEMVNTATEIRRRVKSASVLGEKAPLPVWAAGTLVAQTNSGPSGPLLRAESRSASSLGMNYHHPEMDASFVSNPDRALGDLPPLADLKNR